MVTGTIVRTTMIYIHTYSPTYVCLFVAIEMNESQLHTFLVEGGLDRDSSFILEIYQ